MYDGDANASPNRPMSMCHRSNSGSPSTIHSAITLPMPPAPAMPCAQNPAATKNPATAVSPRQNSLSGVNPSGPLITDRIPTSAINGTRTIALVAISSSRSHASGSSRPLKSAGIASYDVALADHGAGLRSYPPMTRPSTSWR